MAEVCDKKAAKRAVKALKPTEKKAKTPAKAPTQKVDVHVIDDLIVLYYFSIFSFGTYLCMKYSQP